MTRILLSLGAVALIATSFGCSSNCNKCCNNGCPSGLLVQEGLVSGRSRHDPCYGSNGQCGPGGYCGQDGNCGPGGHGGHFGHGGMGGGFGGGGVGPGTGGPMGNYQGGPATPTVAYPYYTTRGPRDFLAANPRGIGP